MANFHSNVAVITGDCGCMKAVLSAFADNLSNSELIDAAAARRVKTLEDVNETFSILRKVVSTHYVHAFSDRPEARQMSDSCVVRLINHDSVWAMVLDYSTAWGPNEDDFEHFYSNLPFGNYGIAFLHASEADGFEVISAFSCLVHGKDCKGAVACESCESEVFDWKELSELKTEYSALSQQGIDDLTELAKVEGVRQWSELPLTEDCEEDEEFEEVSFSNTEDRVINWKKPGLSDINNVDLVVAQTLERFPWVIAVSGSSYLGSEEIVEGLLPGEPLRLLSDWKSQYFDPVGISVHSLDGSRIGNLDNVWNAGMFLDDNTRAALACILPHIQAYAETVLPLSIRRKGSKHSLVTVRLEISDALFSGLVDEVHALLALDIEGRNLASVAKAVM